MSDRLKLLRTYFTKMCHDAIGTVTITSISATAGRSRREASLGRRRKYAHLEPTPLSEDEVRNLPVAHRYSA